jgi:DNA-directed RNA polymerase subunit delta
MALTEKEITPEMSPLDIAYAIMRKKAEPLHFRQLIEEVIEIKADEQIERGKQMAAIYSQLNLDNRFIHVGNGLWFLRERISAKQLKQMEQEWEG